MFCCFVLFNYLFNDLILFYFSFTAITDLNKKVLGNNNSTN